MTIILDPEQPPRNYAKSVSLLRRSMQYVQAGAPSFAKPVEEWLLEAAVSEEDLLLLFEAFVWRLVNGGEPLDRASLHVGTLHPQLFGFAWNWERGDRICDEIKVPEQALAADAYRKSPLFQVIETGVMFRGNVSDKAQVAKYPLLQDLQKAGFTDYVCMPLRAGGRYHNAMTMATKAKGGFGEEQLARLTRYARLFALHVERHIALKLCSNVMTTYLGADAGNRVLSGSIRRGDGLMFDAVIWVSDLRGFTELSAKQEPQFVTKLLNAYFEMLVGIVTRNGGEVLKFIGDGLLVVFPHERFENRKAAAKAAVVSAKQTLQSLEQFNAADHEELDAHDGWRPLKTGIGLHDGQVFFGNMGGAERLDFTVIGQAVNAASRIEGMTKALSAPILMSQPIAELLDELVTDHGPQELKGLDHPLRLFSVEG